MQSGIIATFFFYQRLIIGRMTAICATFLILQKKKSGVERDILFVIVM